MLSRNKFPSKDPRIVERLADELLLFHTGLGTLFEFNETGKSIWLLCDGQNSIEEIETEIASKYRLKNRVREETEHFLENLINRGFVTLRSSRCSRENHTTGYPQKRYDSSPTNRKKKISYKPPELKEVWSERSAISSLFLVEV